MKWRKNMSKILNTFDGFMYTFRNKHYILCTDRKNKTDKIVNTLLKYVIINSTSYTKDDVENKFKNYFDIFISREKYFVNKWCIEIWVNYQGELRVDCKQNDSMMCNHPIEDFVFITINGGELKWYEI